MGKDYRVSASRVELLLECQFWARPEHVLGEEVIHISAQEGKRTHKIAENYFKERPITGAKPDDIKLVHYLMRLAGDKVVASELAMVVNPGLSTVRILPEGDDRDYGEVGPGEVPGTADLVWLDDDDVIHCSDLKTGNPKYLQNVGESAQLQTLALGLSLAYQRPLVRVSYIITYGGTPKMLGPVELDSTDLEIHRLALADALDNIPNSNPVLNKDCWKCLARKQCPAYQEKRKHG